MADVTQESSRTVYRNPWMTVREDDVRRPDGSAGIFGVVDRPAGAVVIPRRAHSFEHDEFYLVEQFRYPIGSRRWEFPAGTAPAGQLMSAVDLARRELAEETGLVAARMTHLGTLDVAPGFTSQRSAIVLAEDLREGPPNREHEEQDMRGRWWTADEVTAGIGSGAICDAQTLAAWACLLSFDSLRA